MGLDITEGVLSAWCALYAERHVYQWAVVPDDLGEPVGSIAAMNVSDRDERAEIGYCIGRPWWNRGYGTEAARAVVEYLILRVGCARVEARHDVRNPASGRVMEKAGLRFEGVLRSYQASRDGEDRIDLAVYGIIRGDLTAEIKKGEEK